jgi:hypothetical protein
MTHLLAVGGVTACQRERPAFPSRRESSDRQ